MRMKMNRILLLILFSTLILFACNSYIDSPPEETTVPIDETAVRTLTYKTNNPMMGTVAGALTQELTYSDESTTVKANEKTGFKFIGWSDGLTEYSRKDVNLTEDTTLTAIFDYEFLDMPVLAINTVDNKPITSKNTYLAATVSFVNPDGARRFEELPAEIRGRGNATWNMEKKSYRLEFTDRIDLIEGFDNGARTWVLLANHCDQTMLRNHTAFSLGQILNIPYSTDSIFVELYLNGRYDGVYQIVEQIQVHENRINIDDTRTDTTNGFLIELDRYYEGQINVNYVEVNRLQYSIRSHINNPEQIEYLKDYIQKIEDAIRGNDQSACYELIDMNSCVATYILQEFMRNIDVGWSSFFMFIEEDYGKMYFGSPWDFDLAAGNDWRLDNGSYEGIYVGNRRSGMDQRHRWFPILVEYEWFRELVQNMWNDKKDEIINFVDEVYQYGNDNIRSFNRNFVRWKIWGWRINQEPEHIMALNSYSQHIDLLYTWLNERYGWLDEYFNNADYISGSGLEVE